MSEDKNTPTDDNSAPDTASEAVETTEETVSKAVDSLVEIDDDRPIEADGDVFWTIQRLFWGIIKTVAVLGAILLLLWFIWRPDTTILEQLSSRQETAKSETITEPEIPVPEGVTASDSQGSWFSRLFGASEENPVPNEAPVVENPPVASTEPPVTPVSNFDSTQDPVQIAYELESQRQSHSGTTIPTAVTWLKRARSLGEISLEVVRIKDPQVRASRIEELLQTADILFADSVTIQQLLIAERDQLLLQGQEANQKTSDLDASIKSEIAALEPSRIEALLNQKIESQQLAVFYMGQARLRDTLLRNVQSFDQLLRQKSIPLLSPATEIRAR